MIVQGTFIFNNKPQNGAIAKLWKASAFTVTPPEQDTDEPDPAYQVGSDLTTGVAYGGDGGFRWSVAAQAYYISVEYDNHRAWFFYDHVNLSDLLTTQGDLVVKGTSILERLPKDSDGKKLYTVGGVPLWA